MHASEKKNLLMIENKEKAMHYFFSVFINGCRYSSASYEHGLHLFFINEAGEDFGDPCMAWCETKEKVITDWINWAGKIGIASAKTLPK